MAPQRLQIPLHRRLVFAILGSPKSFAFARRSSLPARPPLPAFAAPAPLLARRPQVHARAPVAAPGRTQVSAVVVASPLVEAGAPQVAAHAPRQGVLLGGQALGVGQLRQQLLGRFVFGVLAEESEKSEDQVSFEGFGVFKFEFRAFFLTLLECCVASRDWRCRLQL